MKTSRVLVIVGAGVAVIGVAVTAWARFGPHRHSHARLMMAAVLEPSQRAKVKEMVAGEKGTLRNLHRELFNARNGLMDKLLGSADQIDVTGDIERLKQARSALIEEQVKIALKVRSLLSAEQRKKADQLRKGLRRLRLERRELFKRAKSPDPAEGETP